MALPLPRVVADVGPGGPMVTAMQGMNALSNDLMKNKMQQLQNQYFAPNKQSEIDYRNAMMQAQNIRNQFLPQNLQSEISNRNALTQKYNTMTPLEAQELSQKNQFYPKMAEADIASKNALVNWRNMGGSNAGVTAKQQMFLQSQIQKDNPNLTPQQAFEAAGNVVQGRNTLSDGTPVNVSGLTQLSADKAVMQGTTSSIITQSLKANQADAELKVLNEYAQKGLEPYGDTISNMNPQQVLDTFKKDDASQIRLGRFIASQALQYEAAQNRTRLANGQPGVNSTEELMEMSGQRMNAFYPRLSYKARKEAARFMDEALEKGLQARNKFGLHPTYINRDIGKDSESKNESKMDLSHLSNEELERIANGR